MELLNNPYLLVPLFSWFMAQVIKFFLAAFKGSIDFRQFYQSGGMPSGHTTTVTSLLIVALVVDGVQSPLLGIVVVLSTIVIYDALGVRRATGVQAAYIERIVKKLNLDIDQEQPIVSRLSHGHTPLEVFYGALLGVGIGLLLTLDYWIENVVFLSYPRANLENLIYSILFTILTITAFYFLFTSSYKTNRKIPVYATLKRVILWFLFLPAIAGNVVVWLGQQGVIGLNAKATPLLIIITTIVLNIVVYIRFYRFLPERLADEKTRLKKLHKAKSKSRGGASRRRKK